jgi:hypothetical protein
MDAVVFDPMDYARSPNEPVGKNMRHLALPGGRGQSLTCWSWCSA